MQSHQLISNPNDSTKLEEVWIGNRMATAMCYVSTRLLFSYMLLTNNQNYADTNLYYQMHSFQMSMEVGQSFLL